MAFSEEKKLARGHKERIKFFFLKKFRLHMSSMAQSCDYFFKKLALI
jgi:hypothetical protein